MSDILGLVLSLKFLAGMIAGSFVPAIAKGLKVLYEKIVYKLKHL